MIYGGNLIDTASGILASRSPSYCCKQDWLGVSPRNYDGSTQCCYLSCDRYFCLDFKSKKRCTTSCGFNMLPKSKTPCTALGGARWSLSSMCFSSNSSETNSMRAVHFDAPSVENEPTSEKTSSEYPHGLRSINDADDICPPSNVCSPIVNLTKDRMVYLEERDEKVLSRRILNLSRRNKVRSAFGLYKSMEYSGLRPNVHALNSLISCLLRNGMLNDALTIFESMKARETITSHTYSILLKAVADTKGCSAALGMFKELESDSNHRKIFDVIVYNTVISTLGKLNDWVQTKKIWRIMQDNGHVGTTITYRLLVCLFVRCGQNELALDAYSEMVQNGVEPSNDAMQAIIGACVKEGKWDLAMNVLQNMLDNGLKPNVVAFNALLSSLGKAGRVEDALKVLGLMKSSGHEPDAYSWNALLVSLYRADRHSDALRLFNRIRKRRSSMLSLHIYNTALMCCKRMGLWDRAVQLLWQMEASGLPVPTVSYNLVIGACETARKPEVALEVYGHMVHRKHSPDTFTLLALTRSCIWGSCWNEVVEILNGSAPNASLYNTAIQGLCLQGNGELARTLYKKMQENGLKPDGKTRALMLQNLPRKYNYPGSQFSCHKG